MNVIKPSTAGIDSVIQQLQIELYKSLSALWPVNDQSFNLYGRAYKNQTSNGYIPEVYTGANEYNDVFFDDTLSASAFFGVSENIKVSEPTTTADVFLICMVDLSRIKPGGTRNDEEVRIDVQRSLSDLGVDITGFVTGLPNVFKEYQIDAIKFRDTHPLHCFRINFKLLYNIYNC